jgi:hypothetical protein
MLTYSPSSLEVIYNALVTQFLLIYALRGCFTPSRSALMYYLILKILVLKNSSL